MGRDDWNPLRQGFQDNVSKIFAEAGQDQEAALAKEGPFVVTELWAKEHNALMDSEFI